MSISGSTSRHCYAVGCSNGDYKLLRWKQVQCSVHGCFCDEDGCSCSPPFEVYNFPTAKKNNEKRQRWIRSFDRADLRNPYKLMEPKRSQRICSDHFVDGKPTEAHPDPELKLGLADKQNLSESHKDTQDKCTKMSTVEDPDPALKLGHAYNRRLSKSRKDRQARYYKLHSFQVT